MNNEYKKPLIEVIDFGNNDIITTSKEGLPDNGNNDLWSLDVGDIK